MQDTASSLKTAVAHHQAGRLAEAEAAYQRVLAAEPSNANALHLLGALAAQQGRVDVAEQLMRRAIEARPGVAEFHANLGLLRSRQKKFAEAAVSFREAVQLRQDLPELWLSLANALRQTVDTDEASVAYRRALALKPDNADAHVALSTLLSERGDARDAAASLEAALQIKPDHAEAHWRLSQVLLLLGEYEAAWPHAVWEAKVPFLPSNPSFPRPQWDGSDLHGKTILLHTTQGIGDTIQFIRYVPMVAERGARVVLLSHQPKLLPLLKQIPGVARIITEAWEQPQYDVQCSLLALPRLFKTTVATIPRGDAYLKADPALTATWADRLIALNKPGKRVGIVWAGNPDHRNDRNRSMPLEALLPLGEMVGITLYSLQKGPAAAQLAASPALGAKLIDIAPQLNDFADTAAAIVNLDLIISVDTSVAHVAGAMGKPVWLLLPLSPDWRWMLDRADSPWYPSMRLFRQRRLGDWAGVAADVAQAIDQLD